MGPSKKAWVETDGVTGEDAVVSVFVGVGCITVVNSSVGDGSTAGVDVGCAGVGAGAVVTVTVGAVIVDWSRSVSARVSVSLLREADRAPARNPPKTPAPAKTTSEITPKMSS